MQAPDAAWTGESLDPALLSDPGVYQQELERVFARSWLVVAHESQFREPGDYLTNFMGEDPVIVARAADGSIRVSLNRCTHRGNKLCMFDRGRAKAFRCSYHAWTFRPDGQLMYVPEHAQRYGETLRQEDWGLIQARVGTYAGFVFANWDPAAAPLEDYLGAFRPYLDVIGDSAGEGYEVLPGRIKFMIKCNWKLPSENLAGDHYHTPFSHASALRVNARLQPGASRSGRRLHDPRRFSLTTGVAGAVPHALLGTSLQADAGAADREIAGRLGPEVVSWLQDREQRQARAANAGLRTTVGRCVGNIFPNTCWAGGSALGSLILFQWHPRGPRLTEGWAWAMVPKNAPEAAKRYAAIDISRGQSPAGNINPDDGENFERIDQAATSAVSRRFRFPYTLGQGGVGLPEEFRQLDLAGLPGPVEVDWAVSDLNQRHFYAYLLSMLGQG